jgi:hypothetical protein
MAAAKKTAMGSVAFKKRPKVNRPGVHAKTKTSTTKTSKNYKKRYRGQGK